MKVYIIGYNAGKGSGLLASPYMVKELETLGCPVHQYAVKDTDSLKQAFSDCAQPQSLIVCPLSGNIYADAACIQEAARACMVPLIEDEKMTRRIMKSLHLSQDEAKHLSCIPQGAHSFSCRRSVLPGFEIGTEDFHIVMLPADPQEQISLFFSYLFPAAINSCSSQVYNRVLRIMDMTQEQVERSLSDCLRQNTVCFAIYPRPSEVILRLSCNLSDKQKSSQVCSAAVKTVIERLGNHIYGIDVNSIEHALALICAQKNIHVAFAESGCAGLAFKRFHQLDTDGKLTFSSYACRPGELDLEKLGINNKIGAAFGPVSPNVAAALALGASKQNKTGDLLGIGISLPDAQFKTRKAYVCAVLKEKCLMQELDISQYRSLRQMTSDAVSRAFNLARKFADSFPASPPECCGAEDAVVEGMNAVNKARVHTELPAGSKSEIDDPAMLSSKHHGSKGEPMSMPEQQSPAKPKGFKGILYKLFPNKDDSKFDKIRKILMWVCVCVFIGSITYLVDFGAQNKKSQENISSLQDQMAQAEKDTEDGNTPPVTIDGYPADYLPKFQSFYEQNSDIRGWLKIDGTNVNFPVVQTSDNDYYHRLGFDKEYDYYGTPYIDYECDVKTPSTNIIIYGHNIRNDGQMFNDLTKYKQLSFYKEHPLVTFDSVYRTGTYKIFGAFITNNTASHDNGKTFDYNHFVNAETEEEFNAFVDEVKRRSIFDTTVDVKFGDELLTLSTCTYEFKDARFVVVGRRVREGEDTTVDTTQAVINDDAYYPAVYAGAVDYAKKLGKVKGITIDGSREITMSVDETKTLTAKVSPADAPIKTYSWDSSNTAVVTIDKDSGLVTAVGAGKANITVTADDGGFVDNIIINVKPSGKELKKLTMNKTSLNLPEKASDTLSVTLDPVDAQTKLTWKSSDDSIARVEGNNTSAKVIAVNAGTATITAATSDGSKSVTCKVTVSPAGTAAIAFEKPTITMTAGQSQLVKVNVTPAGADAGPVFFFTDSELINVESNTSNTTATIRAEAAGTAVLFAKADNGAKAECKIVVEPASQSDQKVKLSLSPLTLKPGGEAPLIYTSNPSGIAVTWSSSNPDAVSVTQDGYVVASPYLTETTEVTITVSAVESNASAQTVVTVEVRKSEADRPADPDAPKPPAEHNSPVEGNLGLQAESIQSKKGYKDSIPIQVTGTPEEISVKCSSSNPDIVSVDNEGNILCHNEGTVTIQITAYNKVTNIIQSVSVQVEVVDPNGGITSDPNQLVPNQPDFGFGTETDHENSQRG